MIDIPQFFLLRDYGSEEDMNRFLYHLDFSNSRDWHIAAHKYCESAKLDAERKPTAKVDFGDGIYQLDFFNFYGGDFVSRRMRDVMNLTDEEVIYFDIEALSHSESSKAMDYKLMKIIARDAILDPDETPYKEILMPPGMPVFLETERYALKKNASSPFNALQDSFFIGRQFISRALAVKMVQADLRTVALFDPWRCSIFREERLLTKEGLCDVTGYPPNSDIPYTKLIVPLAAL